MAEEKKKKSWKEMVAEREAREKGGLAGATESFLARPPEEAAHFGGPPHLRGHSRLLTRDEATAFAEALGQKVLESPQCWVRVVTCPEGHAELEQRARPGLSVLECKVCGVAIDLLDERRHGLFAVKRRLETGRVWPASLRNQVAVPEAVTCGCGGRALLVVVVATYEAQALADVPAAERGGAMSMWRSPSRCVKCAAVGKGGDANVASWDHLPQEPIPAAAQLHQKTDDRGRPTAFWEIALEGATITTRAWKAKEERESAKPKVERLKSEGEAWLRHDELVRDRRKTHYSPPPRPRDPSAAERVRMERTERGARRFWEISLQEKLVITSQGEVGKSEKTNPVGHRSPAQARASFDEQIAERLSLGWERVPRS